LRQTSYTNRGNHKEEKNFPFFTPCAIAAYNQKVADELLELNGEDEFVVYLSPVGKITQ